MSSIVNFQGQLRLDQPLTQYAYAQFNKNEQRIVNQICKKADHSELKGTIAMMDPEWTMRIEDRTKMLKGPGDTEPLVLQAKVGTMNISILVYHLAWLVDKTRIDAWRKKKALKIPNNIDPWEEGVLMLDNQFENMFESLFLTDIVTTSNYASGNYESIGAGVKWDDDLVDPRPALEDAFNAEDLKSGNYPNRVITPSYVWKKIKHNPFVCKSCGIRDSEGDATVESFMGWLTDGRGGKMVFADARYWSGSEGAVAPTGLTRMCGKHFIMAYVNPSEVAAMGYAQPTFALRLSNLDYTRKVYRVPMRWEEEGEYIVLRDSFGLAYPGVDAAATGKIVNGYLFKDVIT